MKMHTAPMELDWSALGRNIREHRTALGLTQTQLAEAAGVAVSTVQNFEAGRESKRVPPSLTKIERALGWATGSSSDILNGGPGPVRVSSNGEGFVIAKVPEEDLHQAVTNAAIAVTDNLTAREIRELSKRVMEELKQRGLL